MCPIERAHEKRLPVTHGILIEEGQDFRKTKDNELCIACDGSGKGSGSAIFWHKGKIICQRTVYLPKVDGVTPTSNVSEYMATCLALEILGEYWDYLPENVWKFKKAILLSDSKLVVHQVSPLVGQEDVKPWRINNPDLAKMANYFVTLWDVIVKQHRQLEIKWVPRENAAIWIADAALR